MQYNQNQGKNNPQPLHFNQNKNDLSDESAKNHVIFFTNFLFFSCFLIRF